MRQDRGDTIVEVLFAIALLGAVLASAYVVVSRNVRISQASQERSAAVKVAESQLERLKVKAVSDQTVFAQNNFCLTAINAVMPYTTAACNVDGGSVPTTTDPAYRIRIINMNNIAVGSDAQAGVKFKITVSWESFVNNSTDQLDYYYEAYK